MYVCMVTYVQHSFTVMPELMFSIDIKVHEMCPKIFPTQAAEEAKFEDLEQACARLKTSIRSSIRIIAVVISDKQILAVVLLLIVHHKAQKPKLCS